MIFTCLKFPGFWAGGPHPGARSRAVLFSSDKSSPNMTLVALAMNIEALCAAPAEALAHGPSQMPQSCPVAPPSQRELHKDGGSGDGGVAGGARATQAPKAKSHATSCGTSSVAPCAASFTGSSFMSHQRAGGGTRVRVAARRSITLFALLKSCVRRIFHVLIFTCRPPLPLGLPHQQRASNVQIALGATMKKPLMKNSWGAWGWGAVGGRPRV